jgi:hypothetical protein
MTDQGPDPVTAPAARAAAWRPDAEDLAFTDVYGDWDPCTPGELRDLMTGFPHPWWVVGGWSVQAFTGVPRMHEDIDLVVFSDAVPALRRQFAGVFHLWSNEGGTLRVIDDAHPEPLDPLSQVWMRTDARSPWRVDCIPNPRADGGRWRSRHDPSLEAELEDVTWVADDGVRYLAPEVALLFKARQSRRKDRIDLENVWPLLDQPRREWLRAAVARAYPDHAWRDVLWSVP